VAAFCLAAVLPLAAVLVGSPPGGRGLVVELASGLGIVALTLLALQLVLPARLGVVARPLGAEVAIRLRLTPRTMPTTDTIPTTATHPPPSTLRRRLAALRPGRATAIACAIAIALAAVGADAPRPDVATAARGPAGAAQPVAEPPSEMIFADSGLTDHRERSAPPGGRRAAR